VPTASAGAAPIIVKPAMTDDAAHGDLPANPGEHEHTPLP
jgi:hypothetical protein